MNWFSGGNARGNEAVKIIEKLLLDLQNNDNNKPLEAVLINYKEEIINESSSIPLILNRMDLEISKTIKNYGIRLSNMETKEIKDLMNLSNIRYGY